jgi:hypothetical protein
MMIILWVHRPAIFKIATLTGTRSPRLRGSYMTRYRARQVLHGSLCIVSDPVLSTINQISWSTKQRWLAASHAVTPLQAPVTTCHSAGDTHHQAVTNAGRLQPQEIEGSIDVHIYWDLLPNTSRRQVHLSLTLHLPIPGTTSILHVRTDY